jgi:hypothetical protein
LTPLPRLGRLATGAVILHILLTAYCGFVLFAAGSSVIGAGEAALLGAAGVIAAAMYSLSAVQTTRGRWPGASTVAFAIICVAWTIVASATYGASLRPLAGISAAVGLAVVASFLTVPASRAAFWRRPSDSR